MRTQKSWQEHHALSDKQVEQEKGPDGKEKPKLDANGRQIPINDTKLYVDALRSSGMLEKLRPDGDGVKALNQTWNKVAIPHAGPHPPGYHKWALGNFRLALDRSGGDVELFKALFREYVLKPVWQDPTVVRNDWWNCQPPEWQ